MPCHAMPYHAMPCHTMPCHAIPYHAQGLNIRYHIVLRRVGVLAISIVT